MRTYPFRVEQVVDGPERVTLLKQYVVVEVERGVNVTMVRKRVDISKSRGVVILVHGFAQNRYSFHTSKRSFSAFLAKNGFDVFNLDLRNHGRSRIAGGKNARSYRDYGRDLVRALEEAIELSEKEGVFLIGHSLGGPVSFYALSKRPELVKGVATISGVYTFGRGNPFLKGFGIPMALMERSGIPLLINPAIPLCLNGYAISLMPGLMERVIKPLPIRPWSRGSMERPILREWGRISFEPEPFLVIREMLSWGLKERFGSCGLDREVIDSVTAMERPFLFMGGDKDLLLPPCNVEECYRAFSSTDKTMKCFSLEEDGSHFGHIDLILGRRAPERVWPFILSWIEERI